MQESKYIRHSPQSGLSDSDVLDMRTAFTTKSVSVSDLADLYGINHTTANRIVTGASWAHVPSPKSINRGKYLVYPDGRVYSIASRKFMASRVNKDGDEVVELRTTTGGRAITPIALLVAKSFVDSSIRSTKNINFVNGDTHDTHFTNITVARK